MQDTVQIIQPPSSGPTWSTWVQVIQASITGLLAVWIAFQQWRTAKGMSVIAANQRDIASQQKDVAQEKLRHELFDKRYRIYDGLHDLVKLTYDAHAYMDTSTPLGDGRKRLEKDVAEIDKAEFLLDFDLAEKVKALSNLCEKVFYATLHRMDIQATRTIHNRIDDDSEFDAAKGKVLNDWNTIRTIFSEFLRLDDFVKRPAKRVMGVRG
jgi:hypothetical protein